MARAVIALKAALGTHHSPDGQVDITPRRVDHWISQFRKMQAKHLDIPLPWGHQPLANPAEHQTVADDEYWRSRYNAGHVEDIRKNAQGQLEFLVNAPALDVKDGYLVDPKTGTAIKEVSPAICDWPDGKGILWKDSIRHVALCTLPVVHGQDGFSAVTADNATRELRLSLTVKSVRLATDKGTPPMADDMDMDDEPVVDDEPADEAPPDDAMPDAAPPEEPTGDVELDGQLGELKDCLEEMGIHIGDADMSNKKHFLSLIIAALKTHKATKEIHGADDEEPAADETAEDPTMTASSTPTEEQPPMLMSLQRRLAAMEKVRCDERRTIQKNEILVLRNRGVIPVHVAKRLLADVTTVKLSLTDAGKFRQTALDIELGVWRQVAKSRPRVLDSVLGPDGQQMSLGGDEEPQPMANDPKEIQSTIDELAALAGAM